MTSATASSAPTAPTARTLPVTVLGLGAMGRALAGAFLDAGHPTTVWNRTPGRAADLLARGATGTESARDAVRSSGLVIVCLLDHPSVHEVVSPLLDDLPDGTPLVNLTSTTPEESRQLAAYAASHGAPFLDGGIMAVPAMIGADTASLLYSGDRRVFEEYRSVLELLGAAEYFGEDAGVASLVDFALLASMYLTSAGIAHGAAMARAAGLPAERFAGMAHSWLTAMIGPLSAGAARLDSAESDPEGQSLDFTRAALNAIVRSSRDAGVGLEVIGPLQALMDRQVASGHGAQSFDTVFAGIAPPLPSPTAQG